MAVTIKDIAKAAGVSHTTVSRALHDHPAISANTVERIKQLAEELGYVPSAAARGLKTNRSHVVGVIVRRIDDPFFAEVLHGIEDVLHQAEYSLFLTASYREPERERQIMQAMGERRVDGALIVSTLISPERLNQLDRFRVPFVLINNQSMDEPDTHSVYHDDAFGGQEIVQHLFDLGHRRIAYLRNERGGRPDTRRQQGYENKLEALGLSVRSDYICSGSNGTPEGGEQGMQRLLALTEPPTAVICFNDMMAVGAIRATQQAGLRVPEDVSITGFDNVELAAYITPPLTTFHQPKYELGREAAKMMLNALTQDVESDVPQALVLRGELIVRASTAIVSTN